MPLLGMHLPEIGLSERLNKTFTGKTPTTKHDELLYSNVNKDTSMNNMGNWPQSNIGKASEPTPVMASISGSNAYKQAVGNRTNQALRDSINSDWKNVDDNFSSASGALKGLGGSIGTLSKARDAYLSANDENLAAKKTAIEGNRTLIGRNQTNDLRNNAENLRKSIFNTNISLGAAAGSSASEAAAKAFSGAAAKNRATTLTGYGDQLSEQNQNETNAGQQYELQRKQAYDWEDQEKKKMIDIYNEEKAVLDRLRSKVPDWKKADIEAESNNKLQGLLQGLADISGKARGYRDTISNLYSSMTGSADALRAENIGIDAPAALDTPQFDTSIDMSGLNGEDQYSDSYYNPNVTFKKKQGTDIFNNPLVFSE